MLDALEAGTRHVLHDGVGRQLEPPRGGEAIQTDDVAKLRDGSAPRRPIQRPTHALTLTPIDIAPDRKTERVAWRVGIAKLGQRDAEFGGPAQRIHLRCHLPDTVPRVVFLLVVTIHRVIALHAAGAHREFETGAAVVVGIDHQFDLITADTDVAAGQKLFDAVGMRIEGSHERVEIVVVVGDLGLGADARVRVLKRLKLPEVLDDGGQAPHLVVVLPIDHRRGRRAMRHSGRGVRRRRGRRRTGGLQRQDDSGDGHEWRHVPLTLRFDKWLVSC
jgi:hypothetical protein